MEKKFPELNAAESKSAKESVKESVLEIFLTRVYTNLEKSGLPIDRRGRIDTQFFTDLYDAAEIARDNQKVQELKNKFTREKNEEIINRTWKENPEEVMAANQAAPKNQGLGEKLELLKSAIFIKFLQKDYLVIRSSEFDDIFNKVDNIMIDSKSGNIVCALDEVADTTGSLYEEKRQNVLSRNLRGGAHLKYGLNCKDGKVSKARVSNIPVFYLALPQRHILEGIKNFTPDLDKASAYEKNLFQFFLVTLKQQITSLKLEKNIDPTLKDRLANFEKTIASFS